MIFPEVKLLEIIVKILMFLKRDSEVSINEQETYLYKLFNPDTNPIKIGKYNYYEEALNLFSRGNESKDKLQVVIGYNMERQNLPTIHITLPGETSGSSDGIGFDEGYIEGKFTRSFDTRYNLVITGSSTSEVLLIYNVIKACFISFHVFFEHECLQNLKLSGQDVIMQDNIAPPNVFHRAIGLDFFYEISAPNVQYNPFVKFKDLQMSYTIYE